MSHQFSARGVMTRGTNSNDSSMHLPVVLHVEDAEPGGGRGVPRRDHLLQELHLEVGARREQPVPALHHDLKWRDASADYSSLCFELATLIHLLIQGVPSARGPRFG